jgi:hypothetical protein
MLATGLPNETVVQAQLLRMASELSVASVGKEGFNIEKSADVVPRAAFPVLPVVLGVTSLLVLIAAGAVYLMNSASSMIKNPSVIAVPKPAPITPAALPRLGEKQVTDSSLPPVASASLPPAVAAPVVNSQPVTTAVPAIVSIVPNHPQPSQLPKSMPTTTSNDKSNGMQVAIDTTLDEGEKCMARKKYDCALSSANTVLRLDAANTRGMEMKRKAKEAQDKALSQIDIQ